MSSTASDAWHGPTAPRQFQELRERLQEKLGEDGIALLDRAYAFAERGHLGQVRVDGSPYITHPVAVVEILADLGMPIEVLEAGLLHDVVEDSDGVTLAEVRKAFGDAVASLVDGVTKLTELPRVSRAGDEEPLSAVDRARLRQAESLRKTMLAMHNDVRVVLIKLADRLHNMRTLESLKPEKQRRVAQETLEIFAPLANRLGIWQLKWQLEDLSFRYLEPKRYKEISKALAMRRADREQALDSVVERLQEELQQQGVEAKISSRPKHIYSIYRKMERKQASLGQIHDVRAVRVFVDSVTQCYMVLGVVHNLWRPIPGEFDDYIASPKENFYQSLHTSVICDDGRTLEVQIRTRNMHRHAEYGIAAHWRYKEGSGKADAQLERRIAYLRSMMEWKEDVTEGHAFIDALKSDLLQDQVYAFTPKGDVFDLPFGSTAVDFAYHVHTEVGHRCRGARVNGKIVPLSQPLANGDQVEILTIKSGGPSRDWLNVDLGYVISTRAREKIRAWFRRQDRAQHIGSGRSILDRELRRLRITRWTATEVAEIYGFSQLDEFLTRLGRGDINSQSVVDRLARRLREEEPESDLLPPSRLHRAPVPIGDGEVRVTGMSGLMTQMARCCSPVPGDSIIGYTTRGRGVVVHRRDCPNILKVLERERIIAVDWGSAPTTYPVALSILVFNREGLLRDIAGIVAEERIGLSAVHVPPIQGPRAHVDITIDVTDLSQLLRVMNRIEQLANVVRVQRVKG